MRDASRRVLGTAVAAMVATTLLALPAAAVTLFDVDPLDELAILAARDGEPAQVLFAAPSRLVTRTLTNDDVVATVDGQRQPVRLQRLNATDVEVAVVIDTTLGIDELRALQGAVVELALDLPQGATMRIIDATGAAAPPVAAPGPAIAQIRQLHENSGGDIQQAVDNAKALLADSTQDRTALLVVGRDLDQRLRPIDDLPFERPAYVVDLGASDDGQALLGPRAGGAVINVEEINRVLTATDEMSRDLRNLYRADVTVPDADASTLTLSIPAAGEDAPSRTVALVPDTLRPIETEPARPQDDTAGAEQEQQPAPAPPPPAPAAGPILPSRLAVPAATVLAVLVAGAVLWWALRRRPRRPAPAPVMVDPPFGDEPLIAAPPAAAEPAARPEPQPSSARGTRRGAGATRPIAKLTSRSREALAQAHLGLRKLALASRAAADSIPDEMFRLVEARASVALSGQDVPLDDILSTALSNGGRPADVELVHRTATALSTGWQHTARRKSAPPPVLEINAVLAGTSPSSTDSGPRRPLAPVRALNPLVEIGLEHVVLAGHPGRHSDLAARAVTAVDIMRAARLARPVLAMSPHLLDERRRYTAALQTDLGDPQERDEWLALLCQCVAQGATVCADRLSRLDRLRAHYRERAGDPRMLPLVDLLLARPIVDAELVTRRLSVSIDDARALLPEAYEIGWLRPHPNLDEVWVADQVLSLFAHPADAREHSSQPA